MRTGVLKDKNVASTLNGKFVCAWKNIDGETTCGGSFAHELTDKPGFCQPGDGEHNTQLCVFTPDGRLLDVMAGYQTPADLKAELEWAIKEMAPIAMNDKIKGDVKKQCLQRTIGARMGSIKNFNTLSDQKYLNNHVLDNWTEFSVKELIDGRGFGDHFFGRSGEKAAPSEGIGHVPERTQSSLDSQRMSEITAEAVKLRRQWNLAGEKLRREIKSQLVDLDTEYETLKARQQDASSGMRGTGSPVKSPEPKNG